MKQLLFILAITIASLGAKAESAVDTSNVSLQVGSGAKSSKLTLVDSTTGSIILLSTITGVVIQNPHPEVITLSSEFASGIWTIKATPVGGGAGTATVSCHVSYTDPGDGLQKSEDKIITIAYNVVYTPPHGAKLSLTFN